MRLSAHAHFHSSSLAVVTFSDSVSVLPSSQNVIIFPIFGNVNEAPFGVKSKPPNVWKYSPWKVGIGLPTQSWAY